MDRVHLSLVRPRVFPLHVVGQSEAEFTNFRAPEFVSMTLSSKRQPPCFQLGWTREKHRFLDKRKGLEGRRRRLLGCQAAPTKHSLDEAVGVSESETYVLSFLGVIWVSDSRD